MRIAPLCVFLCFFGKNNGGKTWRGLASTFVTAASSSLDRHKKDQTKGARKQGQELAKKNMKIMKKGPIANNAYRSSFPVDGSGQCIANVKYSETMRALGIAPICKNPVSPSAPFTLFLGQGFQFLQQSGLWGDESTK
jgi:hypothetical protein